MREGQGLADSGTRYEALNERMPIIDLNDGDLRSWDLFIGRMGICCRGLECSNRQQSGTGSGSRDYEFKGWSVNH